jgi:hypothetical protein
MKIMQENDTCKLCLKNKELKLSHIIPKSIIKLVRDKELNNRFLEIKKNQSNEIQDVPKEYLLCHECEQKIGIYENYFKETVHFNRQHTSKAHDDQYLLIENINYQKIKLFFLSLLWRMSVSSLEEFKNVKIGENEEILRKRIIDENPGISHEYPVVAVIPLINGRNQESWCSTAFPHRIGNIQIYGFLLGGIFYTISTTSYNPSSTLKFTLNESGRWVMQIKDIGELPFLLDFFTTKNPR